MKYCYYARRGGMFIRSWSRKSYKKARWQKAYERYNNMLKWYLIERMCR